MAFLVPINHWNIEHGILLEVYIIPNLYNELVENVDEVRPSQHSEIEQDYYLLNVQIEIVE